MYKYFKDLIYNNHNNHNSNQKLLYTVDKRFIDGYKKLWIENIKNYTP